MKILVQSGLTERYPTICDEWYSKRNHTDSTIQELRKKHLDDLQATLSKDASALRDNIKMVYIRQAITRCP